MQLDAKLTRPATSETPLSSFGLENLSFRFLKRSSSSGQEIPKQDATGTPKGQSRADGSYLRPGDPGPRFDSRCWLRLFYLRRNSYWRLSYAKVPTNLNLPEAKVSTKIANLRHLRPLFKYSNLAKTLGWNFAKLLHLLAKTFAIV